MTLGEDNGDGKRILLLVLWAAVILSLLIMLAGCKTVCVPTPEYHEVHDTIVKKEFVDKIVIKEVATKDSSSFRKDGDTIRIERWHWERDYRYEKELQKKIDSLTNIKRDSIPYPVPVDREVPAKLSNWQIFLITLGKGTLIIGVLLLVIMLIKKKMSF